MSKELKKEDILKRINTVDESVKWLKNNYSEYKVKTEEISTKDKSSNSNKKRVSKLVNDLLERIFDENKLELDIILYILKGCNNDYSLQSHDVDLNPDITNLIIQKFNNIWRDLNKCCELSVIKSNLGIIKTSAINGKLKTDSLISILTDSIKESITRYKSRQDDLNSIRRYIERLHKISKTIRKKTKTI